MGAEPWMYFVPFEKDISAALEKLKQREFAAGRYFPVQGGFLDGEGPPATIEEALEMAAETGTQSILDIQSIGSRPDYGVVCPLASESLADFFGTDKPDRATVQSHDDFMEDIERGQGVYIIVYSGGKPSEICFAGYSFD